MAILTKWFSSNPYFRAACLTIDSTSFIGSGDCSGATVSAATGWIVTDSFAGAGTVTFTARLLLTLPAYQIQRLLVLSCVR